MKYLKVMIQAFFVVLMAYIGYRHQIFGGGPQGTAPIHAYCPFGALEALPTYLLSGNLIQKTAFSNFWLFGMVLVITILFGTVFCGWICPLGAVGEWLYSIRRMVYKRKFYIPQKAEHILAYGRYVMLGFIMYMSYSVGKLWFERYDPFTLIFHTNVETTIGWVIIGLFVIASLLVERVWCRFLCPLGGLLSIFGKFSIFKIVRDTSNCLNCKKCSGVCPVGIDVANSQTVSKANCISCYRCVKSCPKENILSVKSRITAFGSLKPVVVGFLAVAILGGAWGLVYTSGQWNPKNPQVKAASQIKNEDEIKGWMKWSEVMSSLKVNESKLIQELRLPENFDRSTTIKQMEKEYKFSEEQLREAIKKYRAK